MHLPTRVSVLLPIHVPFVHKGMSWETKFGNSNAHDNANDEQNDSNGSKNVHSRSKSTDHEETGTQHERAKDAPQEKLPVVRPWIKSDYVNHFCRASLRGCSRRRH
jgi:hypothetical protein